MTLHEFSNPDEYHQLLADKTLSLAQNAVKERQECSIVLSGGKTPLPLYQKLNKSSLPWKDLWWFLGDDRWVPPTHELSNEKMVRSSLGMNRPEFNSTFFSWHTAGKPELAARFYQEKIVSTVGDPPAFDLVYLGLGEDGHTASLFPDTPALTETKLFAVANYAANVGSVCQRLTLTFSAFNVAREIWFLVQGEDKAAMIQRLVNRDASIPAACIKNSNQHIFWLKQGAS